MAIYFNSVQNSYRPHSEDFAVQTPSVTKLRELHKPTSIKRFTVEVEPGWSIYVEESGNPQGIPAVFFHGGPGIRFSETDHQWFDPEKYRIVVFQQRGTWGCTPSAEDFLTSSQTFKDVTIQTLVYDIEVLRKQLNIEKWVVFGGSWGSALSVFYAQEYPERCLGIIVQGIFLVTYKENALFLNRTRHERQCGDDWKQEALDRIVVYARSKGLEVSLDDTPGIYAAYRELCVIHDDRTAQRIWTAFEEFVDDPKNIRAFERLMTDALETTPEERSSGIWETLMMDSVSRTYNLLEQSRLRSLCKVPVQVVQGAKDNLCHHTIAEELVDGLKSIGCDVKYTLVEDGPHETDHPAMIDALIQATDTFAVSKNF